MAQDALLAMESKLGSVEEPRSYLRKILFRRSVLWILRRRRLASSLCPTRSLASGRHGCRIGLMARWGEIRQVPAGAESPNAVMVLRRDGCGFCSRLQRALGRTDLPVRYVDVWAGTPEADAAMAVVRAITGGSETVPTVVVGNVGLVNPSVDQIRAAIAAHAPSLAAG